MVKRRRRERVSRTQIRGTYYLTQAGAKANEVRSLILRRRLQILVHSCIYYELNDNIIPDSLWNSWAVELVKLQKQYPKISSRVDYHREFMDFDGNTGFGLPLKNPEIMNKAKYLLRIHRKGEHQ